MTQRSVWLHKAISGSARLVPDRPAFGLLAQLVERLVYTQLVVGSSPAQSTMRSSQWESGPLWGVQCHSGVPG